MSRVTLLEASQEDTCRVAPNMDITPSSEGVPYKLAVNTRGIGPLRLQG